MSSVENIGRESMMRLWDLQESRKLAGAMDAVADLGYDEYVVEFCFNPESYYYPDVVGGEIRKPVKTPDDKIAVCSLQPRNVYVAEAPKLHPYQHSVLSKAGFTERQIDDVECKLKSEPKLVNADPDGNRLASVYSPATDTPLCEDAVIKPKPMIIFDDGSTRFETLESDPGIALHEIVHVIQTLVHPFHVEPRKLEVELEAYSVHAQMLGIYAVAPTSATLAAVRINEFRVKYLGQKTFVPDTEFVRLFNRVPQFSGIAREIA